MITYLELVKAVRGAQKRPFSYLTPRKAKKRMRLLVKQAVRDYHRTAVRALFSDCAVADNDTRSEWEMKVREGSGLVSIS